MSKNKEKDCVFEVTDANNNYFSLSSDTWNNHIVKEHLMMAGEEKLVKKTVLDPDFICVDKNPEFSDTKNYYKDVSTTRLGLFNDYLKVSVNCDNRSIKTAFPVDEVTEGDTIIYRKK